MEWKEQYDESAFETAGPGAIWGEFAAVALGSGAMLLLLHLLGALDLIARWVALL